MAPDLFAVFHDCRAAERARSRMGAIGIAPSRISLTPLAPVMHRDEQQAVGMGPFAPMRFDAPPGIAVPVVPAGAYVSTAGIATAAPAWSLPFGTNSGVEAVLHEPAAFEHHTGPNAAVLTVEAQSSEEAELITELLLDCGVEELL